MQNMRKCPFTNEGLIAACVAGWRDDEHVETPLFKDPTRPATLACNPQYENPFSDIERAYNRKEECFANRDGQGQQQLPHNRDQQREGRYQQHEQRAVRQSISAVTTDHARRQTKHEEDTQEQHCSRGMLPLDGSDSIAGDDENNETAQAAVRAAEPVPVFPSGLSPSPSSSVSASGACFEDQGKTIRSCVGREAVDRQATDLVPPRKNGGSIIARHKASTGVIGRDESMKSTTLEGLGGAWKGCSNGWLTNINGREDDGHGGRGGRVEEAGGAVERRENTEVDMAKRPCIARPPLPQTPPFLQPPPFSNSPKLEERQQQQQRLRKLSFSFCDGVRASGLFALLQSGRLGRHTHKLDASGLPSLEDGDVRMLLQGLPCLQVGKDGRKWDVIFF